MPYLVDTTNYLIKYIRKVYKKRIKNLSSYAWLGVMDIVYKICSISKVNSEINVP